MIGRIAGVVILRAEDHVVVDTGGVGYVVHVSDRTLAALPPVGGEAALWTDLLVREDLMQLFGFPTLAEREWHRLLQTVQGVGAKAALSMLGALGPEGVARAVAMGDATALRAAPGVGPKLAQRVAMELRGKAPALMLQAAATAASPPPAPAPRRSRGAAAPSPPPEPAAPAATAEALSALANLGYGPAEAAQAVAEAAGADPAADTPALIRAALRRLAPRG